MSLNGRPLSGSQTLSRGNRQAVSIPIEGTPFEESPKAMSYNNLLDMDQWKQAVNNDQALPSIRIFGKAVNLRPRNAIYLGVLALVIFLVILYVFTQDHRRYSDFHGIRDFSKSKFTQPLSLRIGRHGERTMKIGIISDLDTKSKVSNHQKWKSFFSKGTLTLYANNSVSVSWNEAGTTVLYSSYGRGGRGMELSELVRFNGQLLSVDDRTGLVYAIDKTSAVPWELLVDGNGHKEKGFKGEWMTVKDGFLYVGSLGKPWTDQSGHTIINRDPQWVKVIASDGRKRHENWTDRYENMKAAAKIKEPGYIIHEAAAWSDVHRRWYFLPRRASTERYDDKEDERRGTNFLFSCSESFDDIKVTHLGPQHPTHGFSSFKFIPHTGDKFIIALKSEEDKDRIGSYIVAYDITTGQALMKESYIGPYKYEGIAFL